MTDLIPLDKHNEIVERIAEHGYKIGAAAAYLSVALDTLTHAIPAADDPADLREAQRLLEAARGALWDSVALVLGDDERRRLR
jgi:hypothetical protein